VKINLKSLRQVFLSILLFICITILSIIVAEILLRFTQYRYLVFTTELPKFYFKADSILGYDISEGFSPGQYSCPDVKLILWSNELGCFDKPYRGEKNYILLAGDSMTWGYSPFDNKYGKLLEDYLGCRVLKCGVPGYGTKQELLKIQRVIERARTLPKLIIVGYFPGNDFNDDSIFPNHTVINGFLTANIKFSSKFEKIKYWIGRHSIIYVLLRNNLFLRLMSSKVGLAKNVAPWKDKKWNGHLENLKGIKALADSVQAKLLIVLIPSRELVYDFLPRVDNFLPELRERIKNFLEKEGIDSLDLCVPFHEYADQSKRKLLNSERDLYWQHDGHWSIRGNKLAALLIAKYIMDDNLIEILDRNNKEIAVEKALDSFKGGI